MGGEKKCPFFRRPESLSMGIRIGYGDFDSHRTIFEGNVKCCEKPGNLRVSP